MYKTWKDEFGNVHHNYFIFHGEKYLISSIVRKTPKGKTKLGCCDKAQVRGYYTQPDGRECWVYAVGVGSYNWPKISMVNDPPDVIIEEVVIPAVQVEKKEEYYKDWEKEEVIIGWAIYILTTISSLIFAGPLWLGITIYFFNWRKLKLKKPEKFNINLLL